MSARVKKWAKKKLHKHHKLQAREKKRYREWKDQEEECTEKIEMEVKG